jgi:hypothetical protein
VISRFQVIEIRSQKTEDYHKNALGLRLEVGGRKVKDKDCGIEELRNLGIQELKLEEYLQFLNYLP